MKRTTYTRGNEISIVRSPAIEEEFLLRKNKEGKPMEKPLEFLEAALQEEDPTEVKGLISKAVEGLEAVKKAEDEAAAKKTEEEAEARKKAEDEAKAAEEKKAADEKAAEDEAEKAAAAAEAKKAEDAKKNEEPVPELAEATKSLVAMAKGMEQLVVITKGIAERVTALEAEPGVRQSLEDEKKANKDGDVKWPSFFAKPPEE